MRRIGHVLLPVLLLVGFVGAAYGEMALPGTYHGYYAETRWGQKVFHVGPYHLGLSDEAAARLTPHRGRPLAVKVSKFIQLMNPGPATMEKIDDVAVKGVADGLTLAAKTAAAKALQGQGLVLHLTVRNSSGFVFAGAVGRCHRRQRRLSQGARRLPGPQRLCLLVLRTWGRRGVP